MAWIYRRKDSRFWWVEFKDLAGERRQRSTKMRVDRADETRKAFELCRELTGSEKSEESALGLWDAWVPRFLEQRYAYNPVTRERYKNSWRNIAVFLRDRELHVPRQVSRQDVRSYIEWRQQRHAGLGVYEVCKNTALHEIKLLRIVMNEAVASGFCAANPCAKLDVKPDKPARKPRITDAEHEKIVRCLVVEPEWMRISYMIAWEQGCRFSETCLPLADVDLRRNTIGFRTKGHKDSIAEFPLAKKLRPLFKDLIKRKRRVTFEMPAMPGKAWWRFFRRIGLRHLCFHCTRVTFITRCYEAGIGRDEVMRLCGHSSYAAHAIYPRLSAGHRHLQELMGKLNLSPQRAQRARRSD